ncbi:MAG TPA: PAS domain S-box protein [Gemmataceae bacterium]|nr:PAS domain S-box protein [Gemmataceae bacterium]
MLDLVIRYGSALVAVAAASGLRWLLHGLFGEGLPYITFYLPCAFVAMLAGGGPGGVATILCAVVVDVWIVAADGIHTAAEVVGLGLFISSGLVMSTMGTMLRRARRREKAELEEQVAARTSALHQEMERRQRAEATLREGEERLRLFINHAPAALAMFDRQMRYLAVSQRWITDYLPHVESVLGRNHYEVFPECPERWRAAHRRGLAGEIVRVDEDTWERPDGSLVWARYEVRPWRAGDGTVGGIVIFTEDITERKRAELGLRESEDRLRLMADALPVLIAYVGADRRYQFNNAGYERWFGLPRDACKGRHMREVLGEPAYNTLQEHIEAALAGQPSTFEAEVPYQTAGTRSVLASYVPHRNAAGKVIGFFALIVDLSERKQAEEALRASEERLRLAMEAAKIGAFDWDIQTGQNVWTPELEAMHGLAPGEFGKTQPAWEQLVHPADRAAAVAKVEETQATGQPVEHEWRVIWPDGSVHWIAGRFQAFRDAAGKPLRMTGMNIDITERKQAEEALNDRERRLSAILNTAADAIITISSQGVILSVNPATERLFGYTTAEMVGQNISMLMPSPYREEHDHYLRRYLETGEKHIIGIGREVLGRCKDGRIFPVDLTVSEVRGDQLFTGIIRDITQRKELEREVVEIASLEQRRIGADLHDTVGQELTGLNLMADALRADPATGTELIDRITMGLRRCQKELRIVLRGLLPVPVDAEGLMAALADLADHTQQDGVANCCFDCPETVAVNDNLTATHLYLIAKEAVHNSVKHARPRNIRISLNSNDCLLLRVQDDGIGIPVRPTDNQGVGLRIMRNRAAIIGAALTIESAQPTGTVVTCALARMNGDQA